MHGVLFETDKLQVVADRDGFWMCFINGEPDEYLGATFSEAIDELNAIGDRAIAKEVKKVYKLAKKMRRV